MRNHRIATLITNRTTNITSNKTRSKTTSTKLGNKIWRQLRARKKFITRIPSLNLTPRSISIKYRTRSRVAKEWSSPSRKEIRIKPTELPSSKSSTKELEEFCSNYWTMRLFTKLMGAFQQGRRLMSIMPWTTLLAKSTPSRYTKHPSWSSRTGIDTWRGSSDLEGGTAQATRGRWSACGLRNSWEIWRGWRGSLKVLWVCW